MRKYLYPCIVADQCFQYVDDLGTAAKTFEEFIANLEVIFECIQKTGLRLTPRRGQQNEESSRRESGNKESCSRDWRRNVFSRVLVERLISG